MRIWKNHQPCDRDSWSNLPFGNLHFSPRRNRFSVDLKRV